MREKILAVLWNADGPVSDAELEAALGENFDASTPSLFELIGQGRVLFEGVADFPMMQYSLAEAERERYASTLPFKRKVEF